MTQHGPISIDLPPGHRDWFRIEHMTQHGPISIDLPSGHRDWFRIEHMTQHGSISIDLPSGHRDWFRMEHMTQHGPIRGNPGTFPQDSGTASPLELWGDTGTSRDGAGRLDH